MAPEIISKPYNFDGVKADIYALGVVMYLMTFGVPPFNKACLECPFYNLRSKSPNLFFKRHPVTKNKYKEN